VPVLKYDKLIDNKYRFVCKKGTTEREFKNWLSDKLNVYRQRVLVEKTFEQFGKTVFDAKVIGEIPCQTT